VSSDSTGEDAVRIGEVTVTVWPKQLHDVCEKHNIYVLK
jgi:hypothetical protein